MGTHLVVARNLASDSHHGDTWRRNWAEDNRKVSTPSLPPTSLWQPWVRLPTLLLLETELMTATMVRYMEKKWWKATENCPPHFYPTKSLTSVGTHLIVAGNPAGNSHHGEIHGEGTGQKGSTGDEHSGAQQHEPQHQPCYVGADKLVHCPGRKEKSGHDQNNQNIFSTTETLTTSMAKSW